MYEIYKGLPTKAINNEREEKEKKKKKKKRERNMWFIEGNIPHLETLGPSPGLNSPALKFRSITSN
ncbi:hypothetical protein RUM43_000475 [Polyplax serrata]|uniref:Uncharacterized protein n=1 Tax=Polyplax serrata TaxID=468196 RepID=A0AAN8SCI3_POLSC